ncbi:MAG: TIR domain-containing protein [Desulfobacteraceae bacterium]|nr:TIR domain-containing protein [Desulfobacteraceae bacterium]
MNGTNNRLRVFIASPGDVGEEREIVSLVVAEIRRVFEDLLPFQLDAIRWETHAWPDIGDDAQDVINREIGEFDIFVGIMWRRFGTPTKRARSGTDEEFQRAYKYFKKYERPRVMFYFRRTPFYTTDLKELSQFKKVIQFRKELEKMGVLFWEYNRPIDFERNVREHLIRQILPMISPDSADSASSDEAETPPPGKPHPPDSKGTSPKTAHPMVFLAYSHEDRDKVKRLYEDLRIAGFHPWLDTENLLPGQMWHLEIDHAMKRSFGIVLCLSSRSISKPGFFQKEIKTAFEQLKKLSPGTKYIIPVRLDEVSIPPEIGMLQYVDYFHPDGPKRLVETLHLLGQKTIKAEQG